MPEQQSFSPVATKEPPRAAVPKIEVKPVTKPQSKNTAPPSTDIRGGIHTVLERIVGGKKRMELNPQVDLQKAKKLCTSEVVRTWGTPKTPEERNANMEKWKGQMDAWWAKLSAKQQQQAGELYDFLCQREEVTGAKTVDANTGKVVYDWAKLHKSFNALDGTPNIDGFLEVVSKLDKVKDKMPVIYAIAGAFGKDARAEMFGQTAKTPAPDKQAAATPQKEPETVAPTGKTDFGPGSVQEKRADSHPIQDVVYVNKDARIAAVADGVSSGGETASLAVAQISAKEAAEGLGTAVSSAGPNNYEGVYSGIQAAVTQLEKKIDYGSEYASGAATCIAGHITPDGKWIVMKWGDAEACLVRGNKVIRVDDPTNPSASLPTLYENGPIAQMQGENLPNQVGPQIPVHNKVRMTVHQLKEGGPLKGDRIMYSSDGLRKVLSEEQIQDVISRAKTAQEAEQNLINLALYLHNGTPADDYGVHVIFY